MLATEIDFFSEKAVIVVSRSRLDRVVLGRVALHHHARSGSSPACPTSNLGQEAEGALSGAEIREMKSGIRVDDSDGGHAGEIESLGNHLRADHYVGLAALDLAQQSFRTAGAAHGILIPAQDSRRREEPADL